MSISAGRGPIFGPIAARAYVFGETRVGLLALLTFIVPSGLRSGGVVMTKLVGLSMGRGISPLLGFQNSPLWRGGDQPLG